MLVIYQYSAVMLPSPYEALLLHYINSQHFDQIQKMFARNAFLIWIKSNIDMKNLKIE